MKDIADQLKLDMSTAYRRVQAAEAVGLLVNLEDRPRRPGRYKVTRETPESALLLPKTDELREAYDASGRKTSIARIPLKKKKGSQSNDESY